jgi:hypothetical protein
MTVEDDDFDPGGGRQVRAAGFLPWLARHGCVAMVARGRRGKTIPTATL